MILNILKKIERKVFCRTAESNAEWYKKNTGIKMGANVKIFPGVSLGSEPYLISIGNDVELTDGVRILTHDGAIKVATKLSLCKNADLIGRVIIGSNVFVGVNAIILPGVAIGDNVIIGAGSIVADNIESNSVACGVPARKICSIEDYYQKNKYRIYATDNLSAEEKRMYFEDLFSRNQETGLKNKM